MTFEVPMKITSRVLVFVEADDENQAKELAEGMNWEDSQDQEMVDWEVTGKPRQVD